MANVLKPKRSNTSSLVPTTSNLTSGEMGVNMADQKIYINNGTSVVQIGAGKLSGHVDVNLTSLTSGQVLQWNGTSWVNVTAGTGTVTGVTATSPVSSSGGTAPVISLSSNYGDTQNPYASKTANYFLAAPNGSAGAPTFRAIVAADIPTLNQNTTGSSGSCTGNAATATTATNQSGGTVNATTGAFSSLITTAANTAAFTSANDTTLSVRSNGAAAAVMSFHRPGAYAVNFGLDTDNVLKVGGWSMGGSAYPILHSGNYNSYAPTLTGTGASGTWGISITGASTSCSGNSSTATNASYAYNYTQAFNSNWNTDFQNAPAGSTILRGDTSTGSSTGGPGGTWWFQQNMRHTNTSNYWGTQVAWGWEDNANVLKTRNVQNGSFGSWVTYLNSANYNSYAPTLTGTGASGTWGINITGASTSCSGNAATATTATNQSGGSVNATSGAFSANIVQSAGYFRNNTTSSAASPSIQPGNDADTGIFWPSSNVLGFSTGGTQVGSFQADGQFYATSNTTTYGGYFSNANANPVGVRSHYSGAAPNGTGNVFFACTDTVGTKMTVRSNGGIANYSANNVNLSDKREKKDFEPSGDYLEKLCQIPVQKFRYKNQAEDDDAISIGVVAQDVQAICPELVMESDWSNGEEDAEPKMRLSIYQTDLEYAMLRAIQELKEQLDSEKTKVSELETIVKGLLNGI